jgi:hypothetical protein
MAKNNEYPKGFIVERIPPVSDRERQEMRKKAKGVGRVTVRASNWQGKRGSGSPSAASRNYEDKIR